MGVQGSVSAATRLPQVAGALGGVACQPPPLAACARCTVLALALLRYCDAGRVPDTETDGPASGAAEGEWPTPSPALPARVLAGRKSSSRALLGWSAVTRPPARGDIRAGDGRKRAEAGERETGVGEGAPSGPRASGEPEIADAPL